MSTETATATGSHPTTPRSGWTPLRVVALVITLALIVVAGVNLVSLMMSRTTTQHLTFPVSGSELAIDIQGGDIRVTAGAVSDIEVTRKVHRGIAEPTYGAMTDGSGLHLTSNCPWYATGWCGVDYEIVVPSDLAASLRSGSGDVDVTGIHGDLTVVASSGDVHVDNVGGTVTVRSSSGDVSIDGAVGDVAVVASSGDVHAENVQGAHLAVRSSSGDTSIDFSASPDSIEVGASSGDVHVSVPDDGTAYAVAEKTSSGDSHVSVKTDPASSHTANLHTSSGDLTFSYN